MSKPICTTPGCDRDAKARGLCATHYKAAYRAGTLPPKPELPQICAIEGCTKPRSYRGMCKMHATRDDRHGNPHYSAFAQHPYDYLTKAVNQTAIGQPSDCWEFQGNLNSNGYGRVSDHWAHRLAYLYWHPNTGAISEGLQVRHSCDNPPCCNPHHLKLGTAIDNTNDKVSRQRHVQGETVPASKLTTADVQAIRKDPRTYTEIAPDYGVAPSTISSVKRRKSWKHVA